MRNIKLLIEYDGTDFCGWQWQPENRTVQGELENAFQQLLRENVRLSAAGRTDAGVHALGQVVNFRTGSSLPLQALEKGGNALLAKDVRILKAEEADEAFSARFDARIRYYKYVISKQPIAVGRQYTWYLKHPLDLERMNSACQFILGENDFQSFCQAGAAVDHYLSFVFSASFQENEEMIMFEIAANRFLHNMVRILVGTFIQVGLNKTAPEDMARILAAKDRCCAGPTVPPKGLFLVKVDY
jgi:tRNA pseudouridine38-40 synthase